MKSTARPTLALMLTLALAFAISPRTIFAQETPVGLWKTIDDKTGEPKSLVRIVDAGGTLSGSIEKLMRKPAEEQEPLCKECGGDLKDKPIRGLTILNGMKREDGGRVWSGGTILDPKNGKSYKSRIELTDGGRKLSVRGYIGLPVLGRSQVWERVE